MHIVVALSIIAILFLLSTCFWLWLGNSGPDQDVPTPGEDDDNPLAARVAALEAEVAHLEEAKRLLELARISGVADILEQRRHQIEDEGFTPESDLGYVDGELVRAAIWFLTGDPVHCPWPGTRHVPGKKGRINDLTKAGAFIAAEITRLREGAARRSGDADGGDIPHR